VVLDREGGMVVLDSSREEATFFVCRSLGSFSWLLSSCSTKMREPMLNQRQPVGRRRGDADLLLLLQTDTTVEGPTSLLDLMLLVA